MSGHRHHHVELEDGARRSREGDGGVVAHHPGGHHREQLGDHRVHLAGHDRRARLHLGEGDLGDPGSRAAGEQADVGCDRVERDGGPAQGAVGRDHRVEAPLRLEVVVGLVEGKSEVGGETLDHPAGERRVGVDPGADGGAAEGQLAELVEGLGGAAPGALDLPGPPQELLTEPDRGGVLEVGAAGLDDRPELLAPRPQRGLQGGERGEEIAGEHHRGGHVNGGRDHVVGRLAEVDVVVGVDRAARPEGAAEQLDRAVADHLVGVHVGRGAAAGLEDVDHELVVEPALRHLLGRRRDRAGQACVEQAQVGVDHGRPGLDQAERADEVAGEPQRADREVEPRSHGAGAVVGTGGNIHLAHRVAFRAGGGGSVLRHQRLSPLGTTISNSAPLPGSDRAVTLPPWRSQTVLTM